MEAALQSSLGRIVLGPGPLRIGRAPDNTLVISDAQSSAYHAEIAPGFGGNGYQITDLNSTNGTFINEQPIAPKTPRNLYAGDVVRIGTMTFNYEVSGAGYTPQAANAQNYEPTVAAIPPQGYQPAPAAYQQPAAYDNVNTPAQPPYTPPPLPAYPQPSAGYPQAPQAGYQQPASAPGYPQAGGFGQSAYPQAQAGYPQPGGFGQPNFQPPQKRKRGAGLIIAIIVILVVLIGGGAAFAYFQLRSTPQKTLAAYCDSLKTSNAQEFYDTFDSTTKARVSLSKAQQIIGLLALVGGIKDCTINSVTENGSTAIGNMTVVPGKGKPETDNLHLVDENGTWKIHSTSTSSSPLG